MKDTILDILNLYSLFFIILHWLSYKYVILWTAGTRGLVFVWPACVTLSTHFIQSNKSHSMARWKSIPYSLETWLLIQVLPWTNNFYHLICLVWWFSFFFFFSLNKRVKSNSLSTFWFSNLWICDLTKKKYS